ncbi:unnamed protein product [Spodoptera exigua]|nr:unnamed protein product [Spodoptera exigua]
MLSYHCHCQYHMLNEVMFSVYVIFVWFEEAIMH